MSPRPDPPHPRLVKPVRWRTAPHEERGEVVETWRESEARWVVQKAWSRAVLEGLERGARFDELVHAVDAATQGRGGPSATRKALRSYLFRLWRDGHVAMDFGPAPERFGGRYEVIRELGRGGMGVAWLCHDPEQGRDVVVKHAWDYFQSLSSSDECIRDEAAAMRAFDHRCITRLYDAFDHEGLHCIAREYVEGNGLVGDGRLTGAAFHRTALDLAGMLAHIHERGYLLLDPQKDNFIRVGPDDRPVLFDIGLCRPCPDGEIRFPKAVGTRGYIAPETVEHHVATPRSDVFGLGRLYYHLATGRLPGGRWTEGDLADRLEPGTIRDIILALSADDPAMRPADGSGVLRLLRTKLEANA